MRGPSPEVCMDCLKPHRRAETSEVAGALRYRFNKALDELLEPNLDDPRWRLAETHRYLVDLFYHLIRGRKTFEPGEAQAYPAPIPPADWDASFLVEADRFVVRLTLRRHET